MTHESDDEQDLRKRAMKRLEKKRHFVRHLFVYVAVNALLVIIWATSDDRGFFWPMFPLVGWGIGVLIQAWDVYRSEPTEQDIQREMDRLR